MERRLQSQFLDPASHPLVVRAFPVDAPANRTFVELFMPERDSRWHSPVYLQLGNRMQPFITRHAARERPQRARQIESAYDLSGLPAALRLAQPIASRHGGAFEQPAVPRQQDALLFDRSPNQFRITRAIVVFSVESEHAQIGRQPSQMYVEHELRFAQRLRTTRNSGVTSSDSNTGYTATRSPSRIKREKSEDSPLTSTSSTSVCGTPKLSITSLTEGETKNSFSRAWYRCCGGNGRSARRKSEPKHEPA